MRIVVKNHIEMRKRIVGSLYELEKHFPGLVRRYVEDVIEETKTLIRARPTWGQSQFPIGDNLNAVTRGRWTTIEASSPHAYLRQYGETVSGETMIYPTEAKRLLINKTGLPYMTVRNMSLDELHSQFTYGQDFYFTRAARIRSNPYLAIPDSYEEGGDVSDKYMYDTEQPALRALQAFEKYLDEELERNA